MARILLNKRNTAASGGETVKTYSKAKIHRSASSRWKTRSLSRSKNLLTGTGAEQQQITTIVLHQDAPKFFKGRIHFPGPAQRYSEPNWSLSSSTSAPARLFSRLVLLDGVIPQLIGLVFAHVDSCFD